MQRDWLRRVPCRHTAVHLSFSGKKGAAYVCFSGLFYRFSYPGLWRQPAYQAAEAAEKGRHRPDRHGWKIRRHQDALRRAGQCQLPPPQLRPGGGGRSKGAGRQALPHRLQYHVPRQPEERVGAPGVRMAERLYPPHGRLPPPDRRRVEGHRRRAGAGPGRRVRKGGQDRPGHHGRGRIHQPHPLQGPRNDRLRRDHQEHRHGLRFPGRQMRAAQQRKSPDRSRTLPGLQALPAGVRQRGSGLRRGRPEDDCGPGTLRGLRPVPGGLQL